MNYFLGILVCAAVAIYLIKILGDSSKLEDEILDLKFELWSLASKHVKEDLEVEHPGMYSIMIEVRAQELLHEFDFTDVAKRHIPITDPSAATKSLSKAMFSAVDLALYRAIMESTPNCGSREEYLEISDLLKRCAKNLHSDGVIGDGDYSNAMYFAKLLTVVRNPDEVP